MKDPKEAVLVVDDEPTTLEVIRRNLAAAGYRVYTASAVDEAVRTLGSVTVDLVITDYQMPKSTGLDLVRHVRENLKETGIVMITGYPTVGGAVAAVKSGAEEYVPKPFTEEELLGAVGRALEKRRLRRAGRTPSEAPRPREMVGQSEVMKPVFAAVEKAAAASAPVLISGASGTGKELAARAVHYGGVRAGGPFVAVNCAGLPEALLECELFGCVKGAFAGVVEDRAGFLAMAAGGTVFLDEVADIGPAMQVKLLRAVQNREHTPVGAAKARPFDARIMAATQQDLAALMKKRAFREDLYFKLSVIAIEMPPLRERGDDVVVLARHFAERCAREQGRSIFPAFTDAALAALKGYFWPGNVRELENVVQRLVIMTDGATLDVTDLPPFMRFVAGSGGGARRTLDEVEGEHIRTVLAAVDGNKSQAAEILGIDRKTLREKLKRIGLE